MHNRSLLSILAMSTVVVGCCVCLVEAAFPTSQDAPTERSEVVLPARPEPRLDHWMIDLEHRVRVGMILYTGRIGQPAQVQGRPLDAVAVTLPTGR